MFDARDARAVRLTLRAIALRRDVRDALIEFARYPWKHAPEREPLSSSAADVDSVDLIAFERAITVGMPRAALLMCESATGYELFNLALLGPDEGDAELRAAVLRDFVQSVVYPARRAQPFEVVEGPARSH